jgi:aspartokinase
MKVLKFGGTSVANAQNILLVEKIVKKESSENRVVVVVSALSGVTDGLISAAELKRQDDLKKKEEELNQQAIIDYEGDDKMASNNTELKIDDDYINSQAEQIAKWACDLQGGIDKYTAILNNILAAAIMEGATAEALESFVDYVENLKDIVNDMGEEAKGMCLAFLSEVDEADSYLY